jgi:DNA-binding NarL/FixJ family response regulator
VVISGLPEDYGLILRLLEAGAAAVALEDFSLEGLRLNIRLLARGEAVLPLKLQYLMSQRLKELAGLVRDRGLDLEPLSVLSPREVEILELMEQGLTNRRIARRLFITEGTVKGHVHQILKKLKVRGRAEAARVLRLGRARSHGPTPGRHGRT